SAERADEVGLAREKTGKLDRSLDGIRAVVDEEGVLEISWRDLAEELCQRAAQRVEQLLARQRHPTELVRDRLDDLRVADARTVDAIAAEAVDVGAPREVLERRALARPLQRRVLAHLDDGLAVLEISAVVIEVEVVDGVLRDLLELLLRQFARRDDVQPALRFLDQFLRVHVRPRFLVVRPGRGSKRRAARSPRRRRGDGGVHAVASACSSTSSPSVSSSSVMTRGMRVRITFP